MAKVRIRSRMNFKPSSGGAPSDFQLPEGNFIPARMPLNLIYPQSDGTTQSHARHRLMHTVMSYEIPIGVQGGAWPFKYELTTFPTGALIGEVYGDANYGVVTCPAKASGTHNFTVRVTDQDGSTIDITWSAVVDDTKFTFIEDGWGGTKTGTITAPLEDYDDYYKDDASDSTYANQIIVFRGGNYALTGDTGQNGNVEMNTGTKSITHIGYPDESPVINCSTARIYSRGGTSLNDIFVAGIRWEHSRQDVNNAHFFWCTGVLNRCSWWDNYFYDHGFGIVGNDNTTTVFISENATMKYNVLYKGNIHDDYTNNTSNGSIIDIYATSDVLVEENTIKNSSASYGIWMKNTSENVSVRANIGIDNVTGRCCSIGYGTATLVDPNNHEVCWNQFANSSGAADCLYWSSNSANANDHYDSYIFRNTLANARSRVRYPGIENRETDGNVVINNSLSDWDTSIQTTNDVDNLLGSTSDGIIDSSGLLVGTSRTTHLGTKGHEVSA